MINCSELDIPGTFKEFFDLMVKHKNEGNSLLVNIHDRWHVAEIHNIQHGSRAIEINIVGYGKEYIHVLSYDREYRNLFMNSTYVIEDMFYRIANAHS